MRHGNLAELPLADGSVDVVVNFQVIEHLWDQGQFVGECRRVLRPGGVLLMSTPNRVTFSPGRDTPLNPFHTRELNAAELTELLVRRRLRRGGHAGGVPRGTPGRARRALRRLDHRRADRARRRRRPVAGRPAGRRRIARHRRLRAASTQERATSTKVSTSSPSRCAREQFAGPIPGRCAPARRTQRPASSPSCCTPTCRGWRTTAGGRSARSGSTSRGRPPICH